MSLRAPARACAACGLPSGTLQKWAAPVRQVHCKPCVRHTALGAPSYLLRLGCSLLCFQSPELCSPLRLGRRRCHSSTPSRRLCTGGQQTKRRVQAC